MPSLPASEPLYLKLISLCFISILFPIRNFILFIPIFFYYLWLHSLLVSSHQTLNMLKFSHLKTALPVPHTLRLSPTSQLKFLKKFSSHDFSSNSHSFLNLPLSLIWLLSLYFTEAALCQSRQ